MAFVVSRPLRNPEGLRDMSQPAKQWIAVLLESLGDQLANKGDGSICLEIGGAVIEFRITKISGVLETQNFRISKEVQP